VGQSREHVFTFYTCVNSYVAAREPCRDLKYLKVLLIGWWLRYHPTLRNNGHINF
jgi:hypothetical protein